MSAQSDASLLRDWTIGGSEEAFGLLARRYAGLLYHAALRRTGREDLAGEAAQNSLLILARKAPGLTDLPSISGWLHRTACYEAAKLLRRERRHEARMKNLPPPDGPDDGASAWQEAAPLLDQALDALPEKDREVIFLKYFDGLSFEQMARQFGGQPAAWRQRGSRAVERLRLSLHKRGVAVSGGTLAMGLGTTLSQAAPAPVVAMLSASPAAGAAALSWTSVTAHSLHLMKLHPATWVVAALLLSAAPLSLQAMANSSARQRIALLESSVMSVPTIRASAANTRRSSTPVATKSTKADLLSLADLIAAGEKGSSLDGAEAERRIKGMSEEELDQLLAAALAVDLHPEQRVEVVSKLFHHYVFSHSPKPSHEQVMRMAATLSEKLGSTGQEIVWGWASGRTQWWAKDDPEKAIAWYRAEIKSGHLAPVNLASLMVGGIYRGLHESTPEAASAFYQTLSEDERTAVIQRWRGIGLPEEFLGLATDIRDPAKRQKALLPMFQYATKDKSPGEVLEWLDRTGTSERYAVELLAVAAEGDPYREDGGVMFHQGLKADQIAARIEWLRDPGIGDDSPAAIGMFLASTMKSAPGPTKETLDAEWDKDPDEEMLATYISRAGSSVPGVVDALQRSKHLSDPEIRAQALRDLMKGSSAREALESIRAAGITDQQLDELELPADFFQ